MENQNTQENYSFFNENLQSMEVGSRTDSEFDSTCMAEIRNPEISIETKCAIVFRMHSRLDDCYSAIAEPFKAIHPRRETAEQNRDVVASWFSGGLNKQNQTILRIAKHYHCARRSKMSKKAVAICKDAPALKQLVLRAVNFFFDYCYGGNTAKLLKVDIIQVLDNDDFQQLIKNLDDDSDKYVTPDKNKKMSQSKKKLVVKNDTGML